MECKKSFFLVVIYSSLGYLLSSCSLDARITALSSNGSVLNESPNLSPVAPDDSLPDLIVNKPSGDPFFNGSVNSIKIDSLGNKFFAGSFSHFSFHKKNYISKIARLNTDGSLDETFDIGLGFNSPVSRMLLNSSQEIILTGSYSTFNGSSSSNSDLTPKKWTRFYAAKRCLVS